jgi:alkylhydroperoxidase family enzyme
MKALILNNNVVDIVNTEFEVHESLTWVNCSDDCVVGWTLEGDTLIAPQFTDAEIAANAQAETNATSQAYLDSTDWYITRHAETGVAVPDDVTTARAAARAAIV